MNPDPKTVTVIVGAGISVPPPTGSPDFRGLRDAFLSQVDGPEEKIEIELDELSPEQVFDGLDDGREETRRAIRQQIWWACEPKEPNPNHYAVAALVAAGVKVWTPNFDTMIETAAARQGLHIEVVAPGSDLEAPGPALYKPHGTFPFPGDPPQEPDRHDYDLLFQASRVWLLDEDWAARLARDLRGHDVFLFGYRGADPDLTPALLEGFEQARSVTWWELPSVDNFRRLEELLKHSKVDLRAGDPSTALQELGRSLTSYTVPSPRQPLPSRDLPRFKLSKVSQARLVGQLRGASRARWFLFQALFLDRGADRRMLMLKLLRSAGYDLPWVRTPVLLSLSALLKVPRVRERPMLAELYATLLDSRSQRRSDRRAIARLRAASTGTRPEILTRIASIEKLSGDLGEAAADAENSLAQLQRERAPALEAMTIYILVWTYRQQGELERRQEMVERYWSRMPHIGFNWSAWLHLDEVLVALHGGRSERARELMKSPFLDYARRLIRHPMFCLDDDLTEALVRWHEHGPKGIDALLESILARHPVRRLAHPPFTAIDTLIVLADHARATGQIERMRRLLWKVRKCTGSELQLAEAELVEVVAEGDREAMEHFRDAAAAKGFGLIAGTAEAAIAYLDGRQQRDGIVYQPDLPLAGGY